MNRIFSILALFAAVAALAVVPAIAGIPLATKAAALEGDYLESRTCDIFTGPCFANAQVGLTGKEAILAWSIKRGEYEGVDLSGMKVIAAVKGSDTLGFGGGLAINPLPIKSVILIDSAATPAQREALKNLVIHRGRHLGDVVRVVSTPIEMSIDATLSVGKLSAGKLVSIETRKIKQCDCHCTNEKIFYPPLADVRTFRPAVTVDGHYSGPGLGTRWSNPNTRSAFVAQFTY